MKAFCTLAFIDKFLQTTEYVSVHKLFNAFSFFGKKSNQIPVLNIILLKNTFYIFKGQYAISYMYKKDQTIYKMGIDFVPKDLIFLFSTRITFGFVIVYNLLYDQY